MATSSKDIEALWKRYSDEGVKRGISVTQFFESNEIMAIPEILSGINIKEAVVSIDAMGAKRDVVELIVRNKGDYLLA